MARRPSDVPPDRVRSLNAGEIETRDLAESLAIDFAALVRAVSPAIDTAALKETVRGKRLGVTRRMPIAAQLLAEHPFDDLARHPSDTVRGWACYVIGQETGLDLQRRFERLKPLADDPHYGVREWAWLAVRPHIVEGPDSAIDLLSPWASSASANIPRFASEATRPRGVWSAHIAALKHDPTPGLAILEPLRSDPSKYVQDSVANWLNDASKTAPQWTQAVCRRWLQEFDTPATRRITSRATRSIRGA